MRYLTLLLIVSVLSGGQSMPAERAIDDAKKLIAKEPDKPDGHNALAMALARRARETAETKYYEQAEEAIKKSLSLVPDNFQALKVRCWVLLGRHEFAQALTLAKQLHKKTADDPMVYGFLTDAHIELGNYKEAEDAGQWMLDLSRSGIPALTRAAYLRELFGDIDGALELMRAAYTRMDPSEVEDRAWTLVQSGHLLQIVGKLSEAEGALTEALKLVPDYHYALAGLAKVRSAQGAHEEAVKLMSRRYDLAPHPENLFDVAASLHRAGRKDEAVSTFARFEKLALAESESWDNANRELISYYADYAGKPAEALKIAKREIGRRKDVGTIDAYAWALHRSGMHRQASQEIAKALAVGTVDPKIREHAKEIDSVAGADVARK